MAWIRYYFEIKWHTEYTFSKAKKAGRWVAPICAVATRKGRHAKKPLPIFAMQYVCGWRRRRKKTASNALKKQRSPSSRCRKFFKWWYQELRCRRGGETWCAATSWCNRWFALKQRASCRFGGERAAPGRRAVFAGSSRESLASALRARHFETLTRLLSVICYRLSGVRDHRYRLQRAGYGRWDEKWLSVVVICYREGNDKLDKHVVSARTFMPRWFH